MTSSAPSSPVSLLHPLDVFYREAGRALPWHEAVPPEAIPEPMRGLLAHNRDMTSTLEQHHGDGIHLRVLSLGHDATSLRRQVVLCRDRDDAPVEFGATLAWLNEFEEPWRSEIVASRRPPSAPGRAAHRGWPCKAPSTAAIPDSPRAGPQRHRR